MDADGNGDEHDDDEDAGADAQQRQHPRVQLHALQLVVWNGRWKARGLDRFDTFWTWLATLWPSLGDLSDLRRRQILDKESRRLKSKEKCIRSVLLLKLE